jgi:hypothetical protein
MKNNKRKMPSQKKIFEHWQNIIDDINYQQCFACSSLDTKRLERAHILARCSGGSDTVDNLHLLCRYCHISSETVSGKAYWQWFKHTSDNWVQITLARCLPKINASKSMARLN